VLGIAGSVASFLAQLQNVVSTVLVERFSKEVNKVIPTLTEYSSREITRRGFDQIREIFEFAYM